MAIEARKSAFGRSWDWKPPLVPIPGEQPSAVRCLQISGDKRVLRIDPSQPVALRPSTSYTLSGKARIESGVTLRTEWNGKQFEVPVTPEVAGWSNFSQEFETSAKQFFLQPLSLRFEGDGSAWVLEMSLRESAGGPELLWEAALNRPIRGYYNPLDSSMLDALLTSAEKHGIYLQLCYLTRDLYMSALKNPDSAEYDLAIKDAQKALRYAVARWGCSTSVAAWEYWNEMDPGLPTDRFYTELGNFLERQDPYRHLRTTSTWGPSAKDMRHPKLDFADVHFYLRPADKGRLEDEVDAVLERTRWLRQQAPAKPAHLGEFGLADDKWRPTKEMKSSRSIVDFHNGLWASALSGASGTAMSWWWDRLDQRDPYSHYLALSRFIADVPWTSGQVDGAEAACSDPRVRAVGLRAGDKAWLWLFNRQSAWASMVVDNREPAPVERQSLEVRKLPPGGYEIEWYDTAAGHIVRRQTDSVSGGGLLRVEAPAFSQDL